MENKVKEYHVVLNWEPNEVALSEKHYSRNYNLSLGEREPILGSNGKNFGGPETKYDPEMLLLSGLSSCYHLSYLFLLNRNKIDLVAYQDKPVLSLVQETLTFRIDNIVLKPTITLKNESDLEKAKELIPQAKNVCFVGKTLKIPYTVEPEFKFN